MNVASPNLGRLAVRVRRRGGGRQLRKTSARGTRPLVHRTVRSQNLRFPCRLVETVEGEGNGSDDDTAGQQDANICCHIAGANLAWAG